MGIDAKSEFRPIIVVCLGMLLIAVIVASGNLNVRFDMLIMDFPGMKALVGFLGL